MKFKTINLHFQESDCGRYRISFSKDPAGNAYLVLWHKGQNIADRRVPNFNEDRQIAMKELYAAAQEHADANQ